MNIKYVPNFILWLYQCRWDAMWQAGRAVVYEWTPPFQYDEIMTEINIRKNNEVMK